MKQLILFRHAKSRWDQPVNDRERDLLEIGIERTQKAARELSMNLDFIPERWFSSSATRALKTAEIAAQYFGNPEIEINDGLYTFSFFDLLKTVRNLEDNFNSVILFGHNEAFTEFVSRMGNNYIEHLPTSGIAWIEFDVKHWKQIEKGNTRLIIKPKNL